MKYEEGLTIIFSEGPETKTYQMRQNCFTPEDLDHIKQWLEASLWVVSETDDSDVTPTKEGEE